MNLRRVAITAAFAASALLATSAQAQIYKWVDERGVTQYSETPPVNGKASRLVVSGPLSQAGTVRDGPQQWAEKEVEFRKRQVDRTTAERAEQQQKLARREECVRARDDLAYQSQAGVFWETNDKGEKVYRTEAQQAAVVQAARKRADDLCR